MGIARKIRKKYQTPRHPWKKSNIEEERVLTKEYGLKNKKEVWKVKSKLNNYQKQVKKIIRSKTEQSKKEKEFLMNKLIRLGLIKHGAHIEDILSLETDDLMKRRLQTIVFKKGLARSIKQARQFIIHRHVLVKGKKITAPSYIVDLEEEKNISFSPYSNLSDNKHPERIVLEKKEVKSSDKEDKE